VAVYCSSSTITPQLPTGHAISSFTSIIAAATSWVDSRLSPKYWPFPDITSTNPVTPEIVRKACEMYAVYLSLMQLGPSNRHAVNWANTLRENARLMLDELVDDNFPVQVPLSSVANEDISLGAVGLADEHYFACAPRDIVPESVVVTNQAGSTYYRNGADYMAYYSGEHRGWMLRIVNPAIVEDDHVSYDYSHLKRREIDAPPGHDTVVLVRA
jgi:hypothetical protein